MPADLNIGILYFAAIGSISTLGMLTAGWGSDNKYALAERFPRGRPVDQLRSAHGLWRSSPSCWSPARCPRARIVDAQLQKGWFIFSMPGVFLIYLLAASAELGRCPVRPDGGGLGDRRRPLDRV